MPRRHPPFAAAWLAVGALLGCDAPPSADLILHGGRIHTLDESLGVVEALAITGDRIAAVGADDEVLRRRGPETETVALDGRTVVPGLTDNHFHSLGGGSGVDLSGVRTLAELKQAIAARAADTETGGLVVTNSNWHEGQLAEARLPLRDDLDEAAPDHPVVVVRGGHEFILNSPALARFGIEETAEAPPGGRIGRYPDGRLNGELVDRAKDPVRLPRDEPEGDPAERLLDQIRTMAAYGITALRIPGGSPEQFGRFRTLAEENRLPVRIEFLFRLRGAEPDEVASVVDSWGVGPEFSTGLLSVGGVKLGVDGGFEGGWMREPYEEPWGRGGTYFGLQTMPTESFHQTVLTLNRLGWRVGTHAVGDAAMDLVLDAYEAAHAESRVTGRRWIIEHGFIPAPDQFERMRRMGVSVTAQHHLYVAAPSLVSYWGADRAALTTPVGLYAAEGIPVSLGTDSPVVPHNPFEVLYHFVSRDTLSAGVQGPEHAVSRDEALLHMTRDYAWQVFAETRRGTLAPGMDADLAVLADSYFAVPEGDIPGLSAALTIAAGRITHRAAPAGEAP